MTKMQFHKITAKVHKWAGITVGIQVFLWLLGGFVMSWFDIEEVRGEHLVLSGAPIEVTSEAFNMKALDQFVSTNGRPLRSVRAESLNGEPVFKVSYLDGEHAILDPLTAKPLSPVKEDYVKRMAARLYAGTGKIAAVTLQQKTGIEYRGPLPVWQVDFDDDSKTSLYFHPMSGNVMAVRTDLWRFYDFMWMLHIMDYDSRDDFNHPLLFSFAFFALLFALSGFTLAWFRFSKRDFTWTKGRR